MTLLMNFSECVPGRENREMSHPQSNTTFINLLFQDQNDFVLVLEDVFEMNDLVGFPTNGQHCDFMQHFHRTINSLSKPSGKLGCVGDPSFSMSTLLDRRKQASAGTREKKTLINMYVVNKQDDIWRQE